MTLISVHACNMSERRPTKVWVRHKLSTSELKDTSLLTTWKLHSRYIYSGLGSLPDIGSPGGSLRWHMGKLQELKIKIHIIMYSQNGRFLVQETFQKRVPLLSAAESYYYYGFQFCHVLYQIFFSSFFISKSVPFINLDCFLAFFLESFIKICRVGL